MKKNINLSVIIISYNTKALLAKCLKSVILSLKKTNLSYEVIVVDNASIDTSVELVKKKYPQTRLVENDSNLGFGAGNNQGINFASGETILLLNSDIEVLDRAIEKLYQFFKTLPEKSVLGGKLFYTDMTPQTSCGPAYTLVNIFTALLLKGDYLNITRYSPNIFREVDWVMGACMLLPKKAFADIGRFDEAIFMYMDEIDWQFRAQKKGYRIYFYPDAHFIHVGAASSAGRTSPILNVFRGLLYYYRKHFSRTEIFILRVILVLKTILAIGLFTLTNKKDDQKLYIEALKVSVS